MPANILVTGKPGSGKTTLVLGVLERLAPLGLKAAGFVTEEIRRDKRRVGFEVRDLGGCKSIMAHVDSKSEHKVGKYAVDVDAFEEIVLHALAIEGNEIDLLVVDEIGRMELLSPSFRGRMLELLESSLPVLATIHEGNHPFTKDIMARKDVSVHRLFPEGRDELVETILESLRSTLTGTPRFAKKAPIEPEGGM